MTISGDEATRAPAVASDTQTGLSRQYARFIAVRVAILVVLLVVVALSFLADVATGTSSLTVGDILRGLVAPEALSRSQAVILWDVRLPYAAMAVLVGAALGLAGAEMQTVLNNPLASPFTLGVSAAAMLGASVVIVFNVLPAWLDQNYGVALGAFVFAVGATMLIQGLSRLYGATVDTVVLFGIAMVFVLNALVALIQFVADADALQQVVFWNMGSLTRATWGKIAIVAGVLALCLPASMMHVWAMTALRGGEDHARSFGIPVERLRLLVMLRVSLLAAAAVCFVGTIGFVGLVGPHIARLALGEDHRFYLPGAALAGALVLSLASIASKVLVPGLILPVGIVTSLVGIPLFMALILTQRRRA
ncbi:iron complex transport system permease protein [Pseudochelatococcus lubricantis]|uniref:Iron complex transport system permease protein n=1 Tax=Pseudochelatococcus lubricantis TaxID=1538102 RepID=A0ABX0UZI7_9HYPH|nr:iron ABC transporter permease [Pseudochelatococcus lubricantis]NIJ58369.1 iron complex transport system permease protein [Pseudochelatococcus lubricantis]